MHTHEALPGVRTVHTARLVHTADLDNETREELKRLMSDTANIDRLLMDGTERAEAIAAPILRQVKEIVGFVAR